MVLCLEHCPGFQSWLAFLLYIPSGHLLKGFLLLLPRWCQWLPAVILALTCLSLNLPPRVASPSWRSPRCTIDVSNSVFPKPLIICNTHPSSYFTPLPLFWSLWMAPLAEKSQGDTLSMAECLLPYSFYSHKVSDMSLPLFLSHCLYRCFTLLF